MKGTIRTAVIGTGSFGAKRAAAVKASVGGELAGVVDIDAKRCRKVADDLGVPAMKLDAVLSDESIRAVTISVPNKFHHEIAVSALSSGKHVIVEKPLARNSRDAMEIVRAAERHGRYVKVGSNHRYFASVMKASELMKKGSIGEVVSFFGRIGNSGERVKGTWFWDPEMAGGGTMLDNGCHLLDLARWFMGDFVGACGAVSRSYWRDCGVEDSASGVFTTVDGRLATINSSWRQLSGYFYFEINGSDGYLTVDGRFDTHGGDKLYWRPGREGSQIYSMDFGHVKPNSYVLELEEFYTALVQGRQPQPSGRDGMAVISMIEAIYKSSPGSLEKQ